MPDWKASQTSSEIGLQEERGVPKIWGVVSPRSGVTTSRRTEQERKQERNMGPNGELFLPTTPDVRLWKPPLLHPACVGCGAEQEMARLGQDCVPGNAGKG